MKRNVLLNPGPATISLNVKMAQIVPDICPREKEFGDLMQKVSEGLLGFVKNTQNASCVLFAGSGTLGVESVIASSIGKKKLAIIVNGAYGARIEEMAKYHQLNYVSFYSDFLSSLNYQELEEFVLRERPDFLAVIHSETTTGLINDLSKISLIAKKNNCKIIADCMSSFACYPIDLTEVDFIIASSNKNIQGTAGISFVIAKEEDFVQSSHSKSLYLDLKAQYEYFKSHHQMRFTPPVQTMYALYSAVLELQSEGLENRYLRYKTSNSILRKGLEELKLDIYPKKDYGVIITSIVMPNGIEFEAMHDYCKQRGFTIYPGKIAGKDMFRISNIGEIDHYDVSLFLSVLKEFIEG